MSRLWNRSFRIPVSRADLIFLCQMLLKPSLVYGCPFRVQNRYSPRTGRLSCPTASTAARRSSLHWMTIFFPIFLIVMCTPSSLSWSRRIARMLKPYGIRPGGIRLRNGTTPKGYLREAFVDAWSRYLPETATAATSATINESGRDCVADVADVANGRGIHCEVLEL